VAAVALLATKSPASPAGPRDYAHIAYLPEEITPLLAKIKCASPPGMIQLERKGLDPKTLQALSVASGVSLSGLCEIVGISRNTLRRLCTTGKTLQGASGLAVINLLRLFSLAQEIVEDCGVGHADLFDVREWLGRWIQTPQPYLGGLKPADILDTPTGFALSTKLLGALSSSADQ